MAGVVRSVIVERIDIVPERMSCVFFRGVLFSCFPAIASSFRVDLVLAVLQRGMSEHSLALFLHGLFGYFCSWRENC